MAISRPLLFALIGALVLLAVVTAVRVLGSGDDSAAAPPESSTAVTETTGAASGAAGGSPSSTGAGAAAEGISSGAAGAGTGTGAGTGASTGGAAKGDRTANTSSPGAAKSARPRGASERSRLEGEGIPRRIAQALERRKVIVLFFGAQGSDDRLTRKATRRLRGEKVAVFTEPVTRLDNYARVVGALPVTQLPSTIVIDRKRRARVVEGFADFGSLRQLVADAR